MTPDVGELCAAGERAFANDEFEEAEAWYELACAGGYKTGRIRVYTRSELDTLSGLISNRFARREQLRAMMYQRSVRRLAQPDPGHIVIVQSCRGREQLYARTEESLFEAGAGPWLNLTVDYSGEGQAKTFFRILEQASKTQGFTALTLFEDDIALARNAFSYIATTKIDDDLAFISWFSPYSYVGRRLPPLLSCIPARDYQFNQAITFPARTVHELLASDALKNWSEPHGADRIYKDVFPDRKVAVHYPNLVQHVGGTDSMVGNNAHGPRLSLTFIGEDADAFDLLAK